MEAAELCMRALKIATKDQRPEIRSRCQSLLNEAERIKQMPEEWVQVKKESDLSESFTNINHQPVQSKGSEFKTKFIPTPPPAPELSNLQLYSSTPNPKPKPTTRLRQPVSTRILPIAEKLLLLHASKLNGFKFPPWPGSPKPEEFEIQDGEEPFK
jgi:hypothetical protein